MVYGEVVDEDRDAGLQLLQQLADGTTLAAAIAQHAMADVKGYELLDAARVIFVAQLGGDDDVGDLADRGELLDRARPDILPMHLAVEDAVDKRTPSFLCPPLFCFLFADGLAEHTGLLLSVDT